ncbi:MAG: acyl carrier protein [Bacteroidales bacterium]|nr:acyl carrier protein [Bacteroidales bacterium]
MNNTEIASKVNDFLVDEFELEADILTPNATWKDIGIDSLDFVDIVVVVEDIFDVIIKGEDMVEVKTLQAFYDFIERKINS